MRDDVYKVLLASYTTPSPRLEVCKLPDLWVVGLAAAFPSGGFDGAYKFRAGRLLRTGQVVFGTQES